MIKRIDEGKKKPKAKPAIHLYRRVVLTFVALTAILIAVVLYFSFVSAKIIVTPRPEKVVAEFTVGVIEATDGLVADQINGVFFTKEVSGEKQFTATGTKDMQSDIVGRVKIFNNYRRPQPLVATTRLLSPDNILLRIKNTINVPVGGTVEADVYADDPKQLTGRTLAAGTRFTIPGIWPELQDKIYAEALSQIKTGENKVTVVTAEDIDNAKKDLLNQLKNQSIADLGTDGKVAKAVDVKESKVDVSAKVGDVATNFTVKIQATATGVIFDKDNLIKMAETKLKDSLPKDKQLMSADYESLNYTVEEINLAQKTAKVKVYLDGLSVIKLSSPIFDKTKLEGKSAEEVKEYFASEPAVEGVELNFFPFWVRKVPSLPDHIDVVLK